METEGGTEEGDRIETRRKHEKGLSALLECVLNAMKFAICDSLSRILELRASFPVFAFAGSPKIAFTRGTERNASLQRHLREAAEFPRLLIGLIKFNSVPLDFNWHTPGRGRRRLTGESAAIILGRWWVCACVSGMKWALDWHSTSPNWRIESQTPFQLTN